ncbi:uncharacterized protein F5147DRAFT_602381 [Suillus discolor]|uniref:Transmembrane protein n=1 Tax=Suillus discolor TaxID=1912936 RepID=A0A9P7FJ65_9AGAM|nr:uncharacterized protein F5147DRAFT_602381 [Suillus discolor]KAG2118646.1 hypothetical protein F5147DRAFT_602381 [Suillus discolor]
MRASHGEGRREWCVIFGFCIVHAVLGCSATTFFFFCEHRSESVEVVSPGCNSFVEEGR